MSTRGIICAQGETEGTYLHHGAPDDALPTILYAIHRDGPAQARQVLLSQNWSQLNLDPNTDFLDIIGGAGADVIEGYGVAYRRWPTRRSLDEPDTDLDLAYLIGDDGTVTVLRRSDTNGGWVVNR